MRYIYVTTYCGGKVVLNRDLMSMIIPLNNFVHMQSYYAIYNVQRHGVERGRVEDTDHIVIDIMTRGIYVTMNCYAANSTITCNRVIPTFETYSSVALEILFPLPRIIIPVTTEMVPLCM